MIISGGTNVYPREIEEVLAKHSDISEVAVIGVKDEVWGERAIAVLVTMSGTDIPNTELEAFARVSLAGYKVPTEFYRIKELPRNASGKVLKTELRVQFSK